MIVQGLTYAQHKLRMNILKIAILITGITSIVIAILAYFGLNMGTFVISLDDETYKTGISLSTDPSFATSYPTLLVNPLNGAQPVNYHSLKIENILETDGDYNDPDGYTYIAYTFYLKNEGQSTVDIQFEANITRMTNGVDGCLRFMMIEDDLTRYIFYKDEGDEPIYEDLCPEVAKEPEDIMYKFESDDTIVRNDIINFRPGTVRKYSIIIWLEGYDRQCVESVKGAQLKLSLNFTATSKSEVDD